MSKHLSLLCAEHVPHGTRTAWRFLAAALAAIAVVGDAAVAAGDSVRATVGPAMELVWTFDAGG
jgi:hypothetical protein